MYYCKACSQPICPDIQHDCVAALMGRGPCPSCSTKDAEILNLRERITEGRRMDSDTIAAKDARIAGLEGEVAKMRDENYSDLLDQMDAAWGTAREIGREEINAFLESRIVHKPTTRLRSSLALAEKVVEAARRLVGIIGELERCSMSTDKACDEVEECLRAYDAK